MNRDTISEVLHFIDGERIASSDSAVLDNIEPATGEAAMKTPLRQSRNEIFVAADHGWIILVPITQRFDIDGEQLAE